MKHPNRFTYFWREAQHDKQVLVLGRGSGSPAFGDLGREGRCPVAGSHQQQHGPAKGYPTPDLGLGGTR